VIRVYVSTKRGAATAARHVRRNPRAAVLSSEYQATNLARKLHRATGEAYVVVDAEALRRQEHRRPMLFYGRHHLIEPMGFEVMPLAMYAQIPQRLRGAVLASFGDAVDPHAETQVMARAARG